MNKNLFTLPIILFFLVSLPNLYSQSDKVTVSGFVRDASTGERLLGVNILLYADKIDSNSAPLRGTSSNNHGFFAIPKLDKGIYALVVSSLGYKSKIEELNITIDQGKLGLNIDLEPQDVELKEILVKGEIENKTNISTIDIAPDVLEQLPSLSGEVDLFKSLQTIADRKSVV